MFAKMKLRALQSKLRSRGITIVDEFIEPKIFVRMNADLSQVVRDVIKVGDFRIKPVSGVLFHFDPAKKNSFEEAADLAIKLDEFAQSFKRILPDPYLEKLHLVKAELNKAGISA